MPPKPPLVTKHQKFCRLFITLNLLLEGGSVAAVICTFMLFCFTIEKEVSLFIMIYGYLIPAALLPDFMIFVLTIKLRTLGIDPLATMFNFVAGLLCLASGVLVILAALKACGPLPQMILIAAGVLALMSGIVHFINGCYCQKKMPINEKYWPPRKPRKPKVKKTKAEKKQEKAERKERKKREKAERKELKKLAKATSSKKERKAAKKAEKKAKKEEKKRLKREKKEAKKAQKAKK